MAPVRLEFAFGFGFTTTGSLCVDLYTILLLPILYGIWHTQGGLRGEDAARSCRRSGLRLRALRPAATRRAAPGGLVNYKPNILVWND